MNFVLVDGFLLNPAHLKCHQCDSHWSHPTHCLQSFSRYLSPHPLQILLLPIYMSKCHLVNCIHACFNCFYHYQEAYISSDITVKTALSGDLACLSSGHGVLWRRPGDATRLRLRCFPFLISVDTISDYGGITI